MTDVEYQLADLVQEVRPDERFTKEFSLYLERAHKGMTELVCIE